MTVLEQLQKKIDLANEAYWKKSKPIISDVEYDKLIEALKKLNPNDPRLEYIGQEDSTGRIKIKHKEHMYSIAKVYSYDDLLAWCKKVARFPNEVFLCSCKYDGLSIEYYNGKFVTRGDGDVGTDITHLYQFMSYRRNFDHPRPEMCDDLVRDRTHERFVGELLVPTEHFHMLKRKYPALFGEYKTPRNLASGFANLKDTSSLEPLIERGEQLVATTPVATLVDHRAYELRMTLTDLINQVGRIERDLRDFHGMPCDGVVVRLADEEYGRSLGVTKHHRNDYCALKFKEEEVDVIVKDVIWQVGERHVTPVATFDPVELDGVRVSNVTLHCADFVEKFEICPGTTLTIIRQGGVIPKVVSVFQPQNLPPPDYELLADKCPCCHSQLIREGAYLSCDNDACTAKIASKIERGLKILGFKGVGPVLAHEVVKDLMLRDIIDWFTEAGDVEVLKRKSYYASDIATVVNSIDETLKKPVLPSTLLQAMCIEDVGSMFTTAVVNKVEGGIIGLVNSVPADSAYDALRAAGARMDGITKFMIWFELNKERFLEFIKMFQLLPEKRKDPVDELVNRVNAIREGRVTVYCFTGTGPKSRAELGADAVAAGHVITDNANQCTTLVCADPNGNSSKLKKARAKGIRIISYDEFAKEVT